MKLSLCCQVEDVYFPKERGTGRRRPFCFVTFTSLKVCNNGYFGGGQKISAAASEAVGLSVLTDDVCPHWCAPGQRWLAAMAELKPAAHQPMLLALFQMCWEQQVPGLQRALLLCLTAVLWAAAAACASSGRHRAATVQQMIALEQLISAYGQQGP